MRCMRSFQVALMGSSWTMPSTTEPSPTQRLLLPGRIASTCSSGDHLNSHGPTPEGVEVTAPIFFHTLRNHVRKLISLVAATGLTALLMAANQPAAATPGWDLILKQDAPVIVAQDVQEGVTLTRVFEAVVRNQAGKKVGILVGQQELLEATLGGKTEETRLRTLVFMLKGGQILA